MATADDVWAQAWSEPDAGSDLAAIRARATRTDGGWLLSGAKTWSSRAAFADRAFGLFRTDPGAGRHRGLTYLLFDLRARAPTSARSASSAAGPASPRSSWTAYSCPTATSSAPRARDGGSR